MALKQIQAAVRQGIPTGLVLADAAYGSDGRLRKGITELGLDYVVGVQSSMSVWKPGEGPLPNKRGKEYGPDRLKGPKSSSSSGVDEGSCCFASGFRVENRQMA